LITFFFFSFFLKFLFSFQDEDLKAEKSQKGGSEAWSPSVLMMKFEKIGFVILLLVFTFFRRKRTFHSFHIDQSFLHSKSIAIFPHEKDYEFFLKKCC